MTGLMGFHCNKMLINLNRMIFLLPRSTKSQVFPLKFGSQKIPVYCHMGNFGCGDGGWTLAMKIDGNKVRNYLLHISQPRFQGFRLEIWNRGKAWK